MPKKLIISKILTCLIFILCYSNICTDLLAKPKKRVAKLNENAKLKEHPKLKRIVLPSGLTCLFMENNKPDNRISLRLCVDVGALYEKENEDGLAHFIEHMVFNGSKNYPPGSLIKYFQNIGVGYGSDLNASTGWTNTIYKIDLPDSKLDTLKQGLDVLYDQCFEALFKPDEISRERNVILSELRTNDSLAFRSNKAEMDFVFPEHLLSKRFVIGTEDSINSLRQQNFIDFYKKWYTPNRMTLVIVGYLLDQAIPTITRMVKNKFNVPPVEKAVAQDVGKVTDNKNGQKIFIFKDKEFGSVVFSFTTAKDCIKNKNYTLGDFKKKIGLLLISHMLELRLQAMIFEKGSKLQSGYFGSFNYLESVEGAEMEFRSKLEDWESGLKDLEQFFRKINTFGFSQKELDLSKKYLQKKFVDELAIVKSADSQDVANSIINSHTKGKPFFSEKQELEYYNAVEGFITPEYCFDLWKEAWSNGTNLFMSGNFDDKVTIESVKKLWDESSKVVIPVVDERPLGKFAEPIFGKNRGVIAHKTTDLNTDVDCIRFCNNVRVNLKYTDFEKDRILISLSLGSGMLSIPSRELRGLQHMLSSTFILGGLKQNDIVMLNRIFADKCINTDFDIEEDSFVFKSKTTNKDLKDQINLIGAYILEPGFRQESLELFMKNVDAMYSYFEHTAEGKFKSKVPNYLANNDLRFGYPEKNYLMKRNLEEAKQWLLPIFAKDYIEIAIVGDFNKKEVVELLSNTFGALPERNKTKNKYETERVVNWPQKPSLQTFLFKSDIDRALVQVYWPTDDIWDFQRTIKLTLLAEVLKNRLTFEIRERLGFTYSPTTASRNSETFLNRGNIVSAMIVKPEKANELVKKIAEIANEIAQKGITQEELERARNPILTELKDTLKNNAYWMYIIKNAQEYPQKLSWPNALLPSYVKFTCEDINEIAKKYLNSDNAIQIIITPDKYEPKANRLPAELDKLKN